MKTKKSQTSVIKANSNRNKKNTAKKPTTEFQKEYEAEMQNAQL